MLRPEVDLHTIPQIGCKRCSECACSMRLAWIEPANKAGFDKRTFECANCHHSEIVIIKYR